ncbi:MAG TPA: autotransporter assembly complex family protein [Candidatus Udaeobacter sp.]|nr:autotransporter assembly complex family protein [Candidatus Udaeobacter sp.]
MSLRPSRLRRFRAAIARWGWTALSAGCFLASVAHAAEVEVEVTGVEGDLAKNVDATLGIKVAEEAEGELTAGEIQRLHSRAEDEIAFALEPFGYYRPLITTALTEVKPDHFQARYTIDPGPVVHVRTVDVQLAGEGESDPELVKTVETFPVAAGDPLVHSKYEAGKNAISFAAADNGYFAAEFDSSAILVDRDAQTADIIIHFTTGPRYHFGPVDLRQNILDPRVLGSYVTFKEGEPYEVEKVLELQSGLTASPYFSRVEARPEPDTASAVVPITVDLEPRKTQRFDVGAGYGTDTGIRGSLDVELRRLNQRGHRAEGNVKVSEIEQSASVRYIMPALHPSNAVYSLFAGYAHLEPETSESDQWVAGGNVAHRRWGWQETVTLRYEWENFTVGNDIGSSHLFLPAIGWERTRADDRIFTRRGSRLRFDVKGAHETLLSSSTLLQLHADAKLIRPIGERVRVLGRLGAARTFTDEFHQLPATLRFFVGGDQSVRGYKYEGIAPRDESGEFVGGQIAFESSAEIELMVLDKWGVAGFFDAGNAFETSSPFTLEQGTGGGIRWRSPVGLVRIDVAHAIGHGNMTRVHIGIGPDL